MEFYHTPVLFEQSLQLLDIRADGVYADLTFGGGGHSRGILERLGPDGRLYGFDQDAEAKKSYETRVARHESADAAQKFTFVEGNFRFMRGLLRAKMREQGLKTPPEGFVDGVLADLGVSSRHFDSAERGFSFRADGPLDMRMNRRAKRTAADIINGEEPQKLIAVLRDYGELPQAHKIAGRIVEARRSGDLKTTFELIEAVRPLIPRADESRWLSRLFQALRIEVNGEMEALGMALEQSLKVLKPGGRLVVISYHSLEDRVVKQFFRSEEKDFYGRAVTPWAEAGKKAITPTEEEIARNPRGRSAKLRWGLKKP